MKRPLYLILLLLLCVITVHVIEYITWEYRGAEDQVSFQRLVGGVGMGATPAIYWDFSSYDPRLEPNCSCSLWPIPGGHPFSPEHGTTIWHAPAILYVEPDSIRALEQ
jgi:hypothetical protein